MSKKKIVKPRRKSNADLPPADILAPVIPDEPWIEMIESKPVHVQIELASTDLIQHMGGPNEIAHVRKQAIHRLAEETYRAIINEVTKTVTYEHETQVLNWNFVGCPIDVVWLVIASMQSDGWDLKYDGVRGMQLVLPAIELEQPLKIMTRLSPEQPL